MSNVSVTLGLKNAGFRRGLDEARGQVRSFKRDMESGGGFFGKMGGAIGAMGLGAAISKTIQYADTINDLSDRLGVSSESLQKWGTLAEQNGSSLEGIGNGLKKLTVAREGALSGNEQMAASFAALGVSMDDLRSMSVDQIMAKIGSGSMNAAEMVKVLGKEAIALRPTLEAAAKGGLGGITAMSDEAIKALSQLKDEFGLAMDWLVKKGGESINFLVQKWKGFSQSIGAFSAAVGMFMSGSSWEEAWGASQKALDQMRAEDKAPKGSDKAAKKERAALELEKAGLEEKIQKAQEDVAEKANAQQIAMEEAQVKQSDAMQLRRFNAMKSRSIHGLYESDRNARAEERAQRLAERRFLRRNSAEELQRVKDLQDPVKQAEAAHKKALAASEQKLSELKLQVEQLNMKLSLPR